MKAIDLKLYTLDKDQNVFSHYTDIILKPYVTDKGYGVIGISVEGKMKLIKVHHFVWVCKIGTRPEELNHINGNKLDNRIENLETSDRKHNISHAYSLNLMRPSVGEKQHLSKLSGNSVIAIRKLYKNGWKQIEIADLFEVKQTTVSNILLNKTWRHI